MTDRRTISPSEYADEAGVSVESVRAWIHAGKLRAIQVGEGTKRRHFRLTRQAIEDFERGEVVQQSAPVTRRKPRRKEADFVQYY